MWDCFYDSLRRHCTSDQIERGGKQLSQSERSGLIRFAEARTRIPGPAGEHAVALVKRGSLDVRLALAPRVPPTELTPHAQDEVYVIVRGRGVLFHDGRRDQFEPGDLLFVAAGIEHRFEDFSDDLAVWVIFYGPTGGELQS
jgi:mannose-6-phosphate isomerase-like protein (cupin superfamily)